MLELLDLPPELLTAIAGEVAEAGEQEALADLALTNRLWSIIATPLLWSAPSVVGNRSAYRFMETVKAWTEESISLGSPGRPVIKELSFAEVEQFDQKQRSDDVYYDLRGFERYLEVFKTRHFSHLTSLSVEDVDILPEILGLLLGPGGSLRSALKSLTLMGGTMLRRIVEWLLQYLHWLPDSSVVFRGLSASDTERAAAEQDLRTYLFLVIHWPETDEGAEQYLARPPTPFPFAALRHLRVQLQLYSGGMEMQIILLTNLFPALVHLQLEGELDGWTKKRWKILMLRRSVHKDSPLPRGLLLPPTVHGDTALYAHETMISRLATPLSPTEIAAPAFSAYRGPSLDILDLSKLTIYIGE